MSKIKFLVMDVDGTLTDGKIYMGSSGELFKAFDIKDGYAIRHILPQIGIIPIVITGRKSEIVARRCNELMISDVHQDVQNKVECLENILKNKKGKWSEVAYIGDDVNDLPCMEMVLENNGIVACPSNAVEHVKKHVTYVMKRCGGDGAVREFIEMLTA